MNKALAAIKDGIASLFLTGSNANSGDHFIYAMLLSRLKKYPSKVIPTMAVALDKKSRSVCLLFNEKFTLSLSQKELRGVLVHEAEHIVQGHFDRGEGKERKKWNYGTDMAINQPIYRDSTLALPELAIKVPEHLIEHMASEYYYNHLTDEDMEGSGENIDSHDFWDEISDSMEAVDGAKELVKKVAEDAIMAGNTAGESWLDILAKKSKNNWKSILRSFFQPTSMDITYRMNRFHRRRKFSDGTPMIPARITRPEKHKVFVAIDVSGSIRDQEIESFVGEVLKMQDSAEVTMLVFDTQIHDEYRDVSKKVSIRGRGGTCFQCIFDRIKNEKQKNVVFLTDGYASTDLNIPRGTKCLWAITEGGNMKGFPGKVITLPKQ